MSHVIRKVTKPIFKVIDKIPGHQIIGPAVAAYFGGPAGAAAYSAANTSAHGGSLLQSGLSAGGSYLGSQFGGNVFGDLGTVGSQIGSAANSLGLGDQLVNGAASLAGSGAGNVLSTVAQAPLNSILGAYTGNTLADSLSGASGLSAPKTNTPSGPAPFSPTQQDPAALPASLQGFGGLDPGQQATNLANQGTYGQGLGPDENKYFLNLVNRQLVDKSGQTNNINSLPSIDNSYLQKLGLGGYGNSNDLLKAISQWQAA